MVVGSFSIGDVVLDISLECLVFQGLVVTSEATSDLIVCSGPVGSYETVSLPNNNAEFKVG